MSKMGIDDFLVQNGKEPFEELLTRAKPTVELHISEGASTDLVIEEISRIESSVEREKIVKTISKLNDVPIAAVREGVSKHTQKPQDVIEDPNEETYTEEEIKKAEELLESENILERFIQLTNKAGVVREEINRKAIYLAAISRKKKDSNSFVYKGVSSGGKSFVTNTCLKVVPKKQLKSFSFLTPKALVHSDSDLSHCILLIQEADGSQDSEYSLRTIQSEGEISIFIPVKNPETGDFNTVEKRIKADGLVTAQTTTRDRIHHENETRIFDLYADDSSEQTKKVIQSEALKIKTKNKEAEIESEFRIWRCADTMLEGLDVMIPFAEELANTFPTNKPRARRDFKKLLSLTSTHCLLYQKQRQKADENTLIATTADLRGIIDIANKVLADSYNELTPKQIEVINKIYSSEDLPIDFSVKDVHKKTEDVVTYRTLQRYLNYFSKEGLINWNGEKGVNSRYNRFSNTGDVMSSFNSFSCNLLEILNNLENKSRHEGLSSSGTMSQSDKVLRHNDTLRQTGMSQSKYNGNGQLEPDSRDYDITTEVDTKEKDKTDIPEFLNE